MSRFLPTRADLGEPLETVRTQLATALDVAGYDRPNGDYDEPDVITVETPSTEFRIRIEAL